MVIKIDVYRKHIAQCKHKGKQDTYKSSEEIGFNSDWKENGKLCGAADI